jgi:predicted amino acid racemase
VGDFREGLWPAEVPVVVERIKDLPGINLVGLGTNLACFEGVLPNENNMALLLDLVHFIREHHHLELPIISGGNSSSLPTIMAGNWFPEVNHLRMGESILLGKDIVYDTPLPGAYLDAFILQGEIIEIHAKAPGPSLPEGEVRLRAVLALGVQDIGAGKLQPLLPGTEYLGATSDHCLVDITHCPQSLQVGDQIPFLPDYKGLLGAMTSPYVGKVIKNWSLNQLSP